MGQYEGECVRRLPPEWLLNLATPSAFTTKQLQKRLKNLTRIVNIEPALIFALRKIRPRIEVLSCQKQAQSSH
jgi:hypothetical protein